MSIFNKSKNKLAIKYLLKKQLTLKFDFKFYYLKLFKTKFW